MTWGLWGLDNAQRLGMATMDDYARQPRDERGRILLHRGVGEGANQVTFHNTPDPTGRTQNDFHFAPPAHWDEAMDNLRSEQGDESYGGYWGTQDEARFYAGDANGDEPHGAMTVSSWWHPDDVHGTENWQDGLWVHPGAQGEVAQAHVYHRGRGWVPLPGAEGRSVTAARLAGANGELPEGITITQRDYPRSPGEFSWHAHHDGQQVGELWVMPSDYGDQGQVANIDVHPDYHRRGVGKALWEAAGRPLHTPSRQTAQGRAWARSVGGDSDHTAARLAMPTYYHVAPHHSVDSIRQHGLDYTKGEHQWGKTPGNYFWENEDDAHEYAEGMTQMARDDGGYDEDDEPGYAVLPFTHYGPVMDDPEGNHELARGRSFYTTDPIPPTAFHNQKEGRFMTAAVTVYTKPEVE